MKLDDLLAMQSHNIAVIGLIEEAKVNRSNKSLDQIQLEAKRNNGIIMRYDPLTRADKIQEQAARRRRQHSLWR